MSFTNKDDAINNLNNNISSNTDPHLTPTSTEKIKSTNLKNWLTSFIVYLMPNSTSSLQGKSPVVTSTSTNYSNIEWLEILPVGTVLPWAGSSTTAPIGFLFCDGSDYNYVSNSNLSNLYSVIGDNYNNGSESSNEFRVPNMNGRVPLGFEQGTSTTPKTNPNKNIKNYANVGNTGGVISHNLSMNEMPQHNHDKGNLSGNLPSPNQGEFGLIRRSANGENVTSSGGSVDIPGSGTEPDLFNIPVGSSINISGNTGNKGNSESHENRMPYIVMKYIIKY